MKYIFIILFTTIGLFSQAQNSSISESQFVQIEMNKLQKHLNTPELNLSNEQSVKIKTLLTQKYAKVHQSWNSGLTKAEVSKRRGEIDTEYDPLIENILTSEQRIAMMKSKPTLIK